MTDTIYLDHNSTTPIDPSVALIIADCYAAGYVNPASQHRMGQLARRKLEQLRRRVAEILGANCRMSFTSSVKAGFIAGLAGCIAASIMRFCGIL